MSHSRWVRSKTLGPLLRVGSATLSKWNAHGFLKGTFIANQLHFPTDEVDAFLATRPHNFSAPLSLDDLLCKKVVLLRTDEALQHTNLTTNEGLHRRREKNRITAIQLGRDWRFSRASIETFQRADIAEELVPRQSVCHMLGVTNQTVTRLIAQGRLQKAPSLRNPTEHFITRTSLYDLLTELLPGWIDPDDWMDDRRHDTRSLVSFPAAMVLLGTNRETLSRLLQDQHVHYIKSPQDQYFLIAPESIDAYLEYSKPLHFDEIARLFGVVTPVIYTWIANGQLLCPIASHNHPSGSRIFYPACMVAILRKQLSRNVQPLAWFRTRLKYGGRLITCRDAAKMLGIPFKTMYAWAQNGQARGILTPAGTWMFTPTQIEKIRRRLQDTTA